VVGNAPEDPRTLANPLVTGSLGLQFYAAAPLHTKDGYNLGTFCILDKKVRYFTKEQSAALPALAKIVIDELELRLSSRQYLQKLHTDLEQALACIIEREPDLTTAVRRLRALSQELAAKVVPRLTS
ncbi:MAG: hypothetical protein ABIU05_18075, partial [Nitrospirales bacterium]